MPDEFQSDNPVVSYRKFYASKPRLRYPVDKIPEWVYDYRSEPFEVIGELMKLSLNTKVVDDKTEVGQWIRSTKKNGTQKDVGG